MPFSIAAAAVAAIGVGVSAVESNESRQAAKGANAVAERQDQLKTQNNTAALLQQNRLTTAGVFANAANNGTGGSSSPVGQVGGINTAGATQLNFLNSLNTLNQQRITDIQSSQGYQANAGYAQLGASVVSNGFQRYGQAQTGGGG